MFKITLTDAGSERTLLVEGNLIAPWVDELKAACRRASRNLGDRELVVDVRNLSAISQEGENLLLELMADGVKFQCQGMFTKLVLRELGRRARRKLEETMNELRRQNATC